MGKLYENRLRLLSEPGKYSDGNTLYLRVAPGGSKSWVQRICFRGKRHDLGLGGFPRVSLAEARKIAEGNCELRWQGRNPLLEKRMRVPTFKAATDATIRLHRGRWRGVKTEQDWRHSLEKYAFPEIGDRLVDEIHQQDVLRILTPIWTTKPEIGRKVRMRIRSVLRWAQAHTFVGINVAGEPISGALPLMPAVKAHFRSLPYKEVPDALRLIDASRSSLVVKLCLEFTILTASRSKEARWATWSEVDREECMWRISAERMKTNKEHRVPLSDAALNVLKQARTLRNESDLIFPSPVQPFKPMSDMTMLKVLRDNGLSKRATVHGFRSSFRNWCADMNKPRELAEAALAHTVSGVEGSYLRSDILELRRSLMDEWGSFVRPGHSPADRATVISLAARRKAEHTPAWA